MSRLLIAKWIMGGRLPICTGDIGLSAEAAQGLGVCLLGTAQLVGFADWDLGLAGLEGGFRIMVMFTWVALYGEVC
jgi:hypothetical protein